MKKQRLVVIGNGMVGQYFLECMTERKARDRYDITVFCEEPRPAYDRVHLSEYFSGKTAEDLSMVSHEFFMQNDISIHIAEFVENDVIKGMLKEIGVDYVQGYGIGKPQSLNELVRKSSNSVS